MQSKPIVASPEVPSISEWKMGVSEITKEAPHGWDELAHENSEALKDIATKKSRD